MKELINSPLDTISGTEVECSRKGLRNAQIYLADVVNSYITGEQRKYQPRSTQYQLYFGFSLGDLLQQVIDVINACHKAAELEWYEYIPIIGWIIEGLQIADCFSDLQTALSQQQYIREAVENKDELLLNAARNILYLTLITILDENFYSTYAGCVTSYIEQIRSYTQKVAPLYNNNNIPLSVFSSIALWDIAHGSTTSSATLNLMLKNKFMDGGGYAEGTDYLSGLNGELLPYYYIAIYEGWLPPNLQLPG